MINISYISREIRPTDENRYSGELKTKLQHDISYTKSLMVPVAAAAAELTARHISSLCQEDVGWCAGKQ